MIEKDIIKKCPHCGGTANLKSSYSHKSNFYFICVKCEICGAQGKTFKTLTDPNNSNCPTPASTDAIEAWNLRTNTEV